MNGPLADAWAYLTDGASWSGPGGLTARFVEHVGISALSLLVATVVAVPLALWLGHIGRGGVLALNIGNVGRAVPTFAVLVLLAISPPPFGANLLSAVLALSAFALPPLLTNTYVGVREVDRATVEAARGLGMSGRQVLWKVELPLATPLLLAGLRLAAVQIVATATVLGLVGGGALGRIINSGFVNGDTGKVIGSGLVVTLLALAVELGMAVVEKFAGGRRERRRAVGGARRPGRDPIVTGSMG